MGRSRTSSRRGLRHGARAVDETEGENGHRGESQGGAVQAGEHWMSSSHGQSPYTAELRDSSLVDETNLNNETSLRDSLGLFWRRLSQRREFYPVIATFEPLPQRQKVPPG